MTSALGWYGPLIDLSQAASHIGHFVQLLVFLHRSTPVQQYKLSKGGDAIRTDIHVGDNTRSFFSISVWHKQVGRVAVSGNVILLQNVKIVKFGGVAEAKTEQSSSLLPLVHPYESIFSKGADELVAECRVGMVTKEKLRKVIEWVKQSRPTVNTAELYSSQKIRVPSNWKVPEESKSRHCFSLSEVLHLTTCCNVFFTASVGEIFLPITWKAVGESEAENMFISRRLSKIEYSNNLAEDFICMGCQLCGSPLDMEYGNSNVPNKSGPLYCDKSANHQHIASFIYRPFMLYVWDESEYMPLFVRNKAAEILFGNIKAEKVYHSYKGQYRNRKNNVLSVRAPEAGGHKDMGSCTSDPDKGKSKGKNHYDVNIKLYSIWLVLLKCLLQPGKNSPLKFDVTVNSSVVREDEKFEITSVSFPCHLQTYS